MISVERFVLNDGAWPTNYKLKIDIGSANMQVAIIDNKYNCRMIVNGKDMVPVAKAILKYFEG